MRFGLQDAKLRWQKLEWRRIAVYGPVNVDVELETAARPRMSFDDEGPQFLRVLLRHEPADGDPNEVTLYTGSGRRIGALCPNIAAWVAPLLDSAKTAIDGEIWPLEARSGPGAPRVRSRKMTLIQYELSPVAQSLWNTSLLGAVELARASSP
jgi:hypothetical protein